MRSLVQVNLWHNKAHHSSVINWSYKKCDWSCSLQTSHSCKQPTISDLYSPFYGLNKFNWVLGLEIWMSFSFTTNINDVHCISEYLYRVKISISVNNAFEISNSLTRKVSWFYFLVYIRMALHWDNRCLASIGAGVLWMPFGHMKTSESIILFFDSSLNS